VVLSVGFGMLALSDFNVNAILGSMVAITIIIALLFDFLFLPSLMIVLARVLLPMPSTPAPELNRDIIPTPPVTTTKTHEDVLEGEAV